jgi:hypothetical protein
VVRLLQNRPAIEALKSSQDPSKLPQTWADDLAAFKRTRERYLLYR